MIENLENLTFSENQFEYFYNLVQSLFLGF